MRPRETKMCHFYYRLENGLKEYYYTSRECKSPSRTKEYKELKKFFEIGSISAYGYQSNHREGLYLRGIDKPCLKYVPEQYPELRLDWTNNFLSIEKFAAYYGITTHEANLIIGSSESN